MKGIFEQQKSELFLYNPSDLSPFPVIRALTAIKCFVTGLMVFNSNFQFCM